MAANAIPRTLVKLGLTGARLPLSIAERVGDWSGVDVAGLQPVAVYDSVEAQAKQVIGRWLHDEQLVNEGQLQARAARSRSGAQWLATEAEDLRDDADRRLEQRVEQVEESREEIEARAEARRAEIQAEEEKAKREAEERARKREQAARRAARTRAKAVEAKKREAELARIQAEAEALEKENQALEAEQTVTAIDEHLEARRSGRRNGSS